MVVKIRAAEPAKIKNVEVEFSLPQPLFLKFFRICGTREAIVRKIVPEYSIAR